MINLRWPKDFQALQQLPFCYLCGRPFTAKESSDRDHVPPQSAFHVRDRSPPLKLRTHVACHAPFSVHDKKVGQLISLRRGETPKSKRDRALHFVQYPRLKITALENLNIDEMVWRWTFAFHAALYREPLIIRRGYIVTPFPRADRRDGVIEFDAIPPHHFEVVKNIKRNRAHNNLDRLSSNNGKLTYECVWCKFDNEDRWFCMFALDIYGWRDLGSDSPELPARGCAGIYLRKDGGVPEGATRDHTGKILIPNYDVFDAFSP